MDETKVALTEMIVSLDGRICDAFAVFRSADRLCGCVRQRKNPLLSLALAYTSVQTVRPSKNSKNKASQIRPSKTRLHFCLATFVSSTPHLASCRIPETSA
ncbi:MAG: hypothetical protein ACI4HI_03185 [Lachnospiraceae bacterium]